jgi:hypothetical protein
MRTVVAQNPNTTRDGAPRPFRMRTIFGRNENLILGRAEGPSRRRLRLNA